MGEPRWVKAKASAGVGACVELAAIDDRIGVRDSKDPDAVLLFTRAELSAFFTAVRDNEFDHLLRD